MEVKIINKTNYKIGYATPNSAGIDLVANIKQPITLNPGHRILIPSGIHMALPEGYEAQMRPRSGLALKHGVTLANSPGTIDADYRDEIGIILINHGTEPFIIIPGMRVAQLVIAKYEHVEISETGAFTEEEAKVDRGGGFGSTGTNSNEKEKEPDKPKLKRTRKAKKKKNEK